MALSWRLMLLRMDQFTRRIGGLGRVSGVALAGRFVGWGPLAGPLARGRPHGRPGLTREEPDQGVRRGRGRPPHIIIWLRVCCSESIGAQTMRQFPVLGGSLGFVS